MQKPEQELPIFTIVTGITTGIILVSLYVGLLAFNQVAWLILFWVKWSFLAFLSGFTFALGIAVVVNLYERFIRNPA